MIEVKHSPTADTRTCDVTTVTQDQLLESSRLHIEDVGKGLAFFSGMLIEAAVRHDYDKLTDIKSFYHDFQTNFECTDWWDRHRLLNRHHLLQEDGIPEDVNLIDVLDHIVDCVMAGMARSGSVTPLALPDDLLQKAFQNTVTILKRNVRVTGLTDAGGLPDAEAQARDAGPRRKEQ